MTQFKLWEAMEHVEMKWGKHQPGTTKPKQQTPTVITHTTTTLVSQTMTFSAPIFADELDQPESTPAPMLVARHLDQPLCDKYDLVLVMLHETKY